MIFVDRFSTLDDLTGVDRGDKMKLLEALAVVGRFSAFEVDNVMAHPITELLKGPYLEVTGGTYPWTNVRLTDEGAALLADAKGL